MPNNRPYRDKGLDALYALAKEHWNNIHFLQMILDELAQRSTGTAKRLHAEISEQVAVLLEGTRPERQSEKPAQRTGPTADTLSEELTRLRAEKEAAERKIADLQMLLLQARDTIRSQEQKLAAVSAKGSTSVYRRVGLDEGCPEFVLKAVRTAYRKQLHPDIRPAHEKAEAERRFKEAEAVFNTIYALRKL